MVFARATPAAFRPAHLHTPRPAEIICMRPCRRPLQPFWRHRSPFPFIGRPDGANLRPSTTPSPPLPDSFLSQRRRHVFPPTRYLVLPSFRGGGGAGFREPGASWWVAGDVVIVCDLIITGVTEKRFLFVRKRIRTRGGEVVLSVRKTR